uniref:Secreted protein n=1 Tax=Ixodes ricinus TaxID=34613 RepID=A0A6B0UJT2_IXORI
MSAWIGITSLLSCRSLRSLCSISSTSGPDLGAADPPLFGLCIRASKRFCSAAGGSRDSSGLCPPTLLRASKHFLQTFFSLRSLGTRMAELRHLAQWENWQFGQECACTRL